MAYNTSSRCDCWDSDIFPQIPLVTLAMLTRAAGEEATNERQTTLVVKVGGGALQASRIEERPDSDRRILANAVVAFQKPQVNIQRPSNRTCRAVYSTSTHIVVNTWFTPAMSRLSSLLLRMPLSPPLSPFLRRSPHTPYASPSSWLRVLLLPYISLAAVFVFICI